MRKHIARTVGMLVVAPVLPFWIVAESCDAVSRFCARCVQDRAFTVWLVDSAEYVADCIMAGKGDWRED